MDQYRSQKNRPHSIAQSSRSIGRTDHFAAGVTYLVLIQVCFYCSSPELIFQILLSLSAENGLFSHDLELSPMTLTYEPALNKLR